MYVFRPKSIAVFVLFYGLMNPSCVFIKTCRILYSLKLLSFCWSRLSNVGFSIILSFHLVLTTYLAHHSISTLLPFMSPFACMHVHVCMHTCVGACICLCVCCVLEAGGVCIYLYVRVSLPGNLINKICPSMPINSLLLKKSHFSLNQS